jgi:hypothetical protein
MNMKIKKKKFNLNIVPWVAGEKNKKPFSSNSNKSSISQSEAAAIGLYLLEQTAIKNSSTTWQHVAKLESVNSRL